MRSCAFTQVSVKRPGLALCALLAAPALQGATAASGVTPSPSPSPPPENRTLQYSGHIRAYYFTRANCSGYSSSPCLLSKNSPGFTRANQSAFNAALLVHADYRLSKTGWSVGAAYVYASPLWFNGACGHTQNYAHEASCSQYPPNAAYNGSDTTLPAFSLATLAEAYLAYKSRTVRATIGDQYFDSPWAGPSDSRIKAAYYQGVSISYQPSASWRLQFDRMSQWESRTSSSFNKSNLIVPLAPNGAIVNPTPGFLLLGALYTPAKHLDATLQWYQFYDIAALWWVQAAWGVESASGLKNALRIQFAHEQNIGTALVGTIASDVAGAEVEAAVGRASVITLDYDRIPQRSATVSLAPGVTCTNHVISGSGPTGGTAYWLPTGGTPNCIPTGPSGADIYYGGIASPYSDLYSTSPLFVTNMSQDMVQRRSPGDSFKLSARFQAFQRRLTLELAQIWNDYTNGAGAEETMGTSVDAEYRFARVDDAPYHGFSLRNRWLSRSQSNTQLFGGRPLTVYNRTQLEFDF